MTDTRTILILGATGGVGGAIAGALLRHGWKVRGMARDLSAVRGGNPAIDWVQGDAMTRDDVVRAATGVAMIVHAVNPAGYRDWDKLVLPMIDNTIAAARAAGGVRVILPGTIYNFDPTETPVIDAGSPQQPRSRKGAIRVAMEKRLEDAAPDVPSLILRAGDFFGPGAAKSSWFAQAMVSPGRPITRIVRMDRGGGHSWAYLPDLAEAFARLIDVEDRLSPFARVQFEGLYDASGTVLTDSLQRVAGRDLPIWRFPWWLMHLAAPFGGFPREAAEIAQYWRHPLRLDNRRLIDLIGPEPRTPLDEAVRASLAALGCLDHAPAGTPVALVRGK
jgi:nucleoside-diphosphate-sugar epimerase